MDPMAFMNVLIKERIYILKALLNHIQRHHDGAPPHLPVVFDIGRFQILDKRIEVFSIEIHGEQRKSAIWMRLRHLFDDFSEVRTHLNVLV